MLHQLGSPLLNMASQRLQGMHKWRGDCPAHVRPICRYAPPGAASSPHALCIMPEVSARNLGRQHDNIMSASSLINPAGLTGCEA